MKNIRYSLKSKITFIFVLILILPLLVSIFLVAWDLSNRTQDELTRQAKTGFRILVRYINSQVKYNEISLRNLGNSNKMKNLCFTTETVDTKNMESYLQSEGIKGKLNIFKQNKEEIIPFYVSCKKYCNKEFINKAKSLYKGEIFSTLQVEEENGKYRLVIISILKELDSLTNIPYYLQLVDKLDETFIDKFRDLLELDISIYYQGKSVLSSFFDADGNRIIGKELTLTSKDLLSSSNKDFHKWIENMGEKYLSYYFVYPNNNDFVFQISIPQKSIRRTNNLIIKYLLIISLVGVVLAAFSGLAVSRNIIEPLLKLVEGTKKISSGDLSFRIKMQRDDEIGVLAEEFDNMAAKLEESYQNLQRKIFEITTLFEISQSMSFVNDSQLLIEIILDKAIAALSAERGSLMLYNEQIDKLEVRVVRGFHGEVKSYTKLSPGEGIAGKVFTSKQSMLVNFGENDPMFKKSVIPDRKTTINSLLCVPIKTKDHVLGVINIVNKISDTETGFTINDMKLLEAISSHTAVTLENARLYEQSITDGMTKLYIHRYFQVRLEEEIGRSNRYNTPLSLIMFDIDHFKSFNDTYGHQTGDLVLKEVAGVIKTTIRKDVDIAARYGGEEFAVIVPETTADKAFNLAERLRINVSELKIQGPANKILSVTISLGIAEYPLHAKDRLNLIKAADIALYYSKEHGRNQATIFDPEKMKDNEEK